MKIHVKYGIGILFTAMILISVVFAPISTAKISSEENEEIIADPWFVEKDELSSLSTEELKQLAETNKTVKKIIEEDLKLEPVEIESIEDLKELPINYPENLKQMAIKNLSVKQDTKSTNTVNVWIVADEEYREHFGSDWKSEAYSTIESADDAFYSDHDINFVVGKYSEWDSNDNTHDSSLLDEAQSETGWNTNQQGMDMMAIFTNQNTDKRGWSEYGGDAWIMKHQVSSSWDWHLAQHEASHNYECPDHGYSGPYCIMTYTYMMVTDSWCSDCDQSIEDNRNHF